MANAEKYYLYKSLKDSADGYLKSGKFLVPTKETKDSEKKEYEINPEILKQYEKVSQWVAEIDKKNARGIAELQLAKGERIQGYRAVVDNLFSESEGSSVRNRKVKREKVSPVTGEESNPFTNKFIKQARMYLLKKYFKNNSREDVANMNDEDFLNKYVDMQLHLKRVSTCNDVLYSALLKDPNASQFIKDEGALEDSSRKEKKEIKKAIRKSSKQYKKESQEASRNKVGGLRDFFTTNKMLRIIEGFDPIPAKYKEKAINSLMKAFEKVQKENVNTKETTGGARNNVAQGGGEQGGGNNNNNDNNKKETTQRTPTNNGPQGGSTGTPSNNGPDVTKKEDNSKKAGENVNQADAEKVVTNTERAEELKNNIEGKAKFIRIPEYSANVGDGKFTKRCILSCDENGNNIEYIDYFEDPKRHGNFIVSEVKKVENGKKTKGFKMSKKDIEKVQDSMKEGIFKLKSDLKELGEIEFVSAGKNAEGRQLYQSYESFKVTSPYISSVIFEDEFNKFNENEAKNATGLVSKVDIMRKFVDYGNNPTNEQISHLQVVNDYLDFVINPDNSKFKVMRADVEKHEKAFKLYKKTHKNVSESLSEFSFAEQNKIRFKIERMGETCKQTKIPRMHGCEDYDFKDGDKILEYCGMKFNLSGITAMGVDKNNKPIARRYYENPAYPGLILLGKANVDLPAFDVINQATETKVKAGIVTMHSAGLGREVEFVNENVVDSKTNKNVNIIVSTDRLREWPYDNRNYVLSQIYADKFKEFVNAKYPESTRQTFLNVSFNDFLDEFASTVVPFKGDINARKETIAEINGKENMEEVFDHERVRELDRVYNIYERMTADTKESKKIIKDINKIVNSGKNYLDYQKYVNERGFLDKQLAMLSFVIENGLEPESFIDKNKEKEALKNAKKVGKELENASSGKQIFHRSDVASELQKDIEPKVYNLSEKESDQVMTPKFSVSDYEKAQSDIDMQYESTPNEFVDNFAIVSEENMTLDENNPYSGTLTNEEYLKEVERMEKAEQDYNIRNTFFSGMDENADIETTEQQKAEFEQQLKSREPYEQNSTSTVDMTIDAKENIYSAEDIKEVQTDYTEVEDKTNTAVEDVMKVAEDIQSQGLNANYVFSDNFVNDIADKIDKDIENARYTDIEEINVDESVLDEFKNKQQAVAEEETTKDMDTEQNNGEAVVEEEPVKEEPVSEEELKVAEEPVVKDSDMKVDYTLDAKNSWTSSLNKNNDAWLKDIENIEMMDEGRGLGAFQYTPDDLWQEAPDVDTLDDDKTIEEKAPQEPMQMPSGINDLAVDALWKDIYKTLSVKDENGQYVYNIGSTTMDILKCASGESIEMDPKRAVRIKEILTKTYANHTLRSLIDNKGITPELEEELKKFEVDMEKGKFKGELNNELLSQAFAEAKYQKISELVSSDAGLSRIALFELSQAKYNPNGGKDDNGELVEDHRRDSWFYRALCKCNMEFDIEKYKGIITDMVNNQVNVVDVTDPNAKQVEMQTPDGNIRVVEVEVNGVKVYVDKSTVPPRVVETQDIAQNVPNGTPLVKMEDVLDKVANERAMSQNMMPKYQRQAHANVENYENITKDTAGNEGMER